MSFTRIGENDILTGTDAGNVLVLPRDSQEGIIKVAMQMFPEEYMRIVKKCGMVEFLMSDDGQLTGLAEPHDVLEASDRVQISRFNNGRHTFKDISRPLTAAGLCQVAQGQLSRLISEWERIKTDPEYLYSLVVHRAHTTAELFPAEDTGVAITAEELLSRPRFVGMQTRYVTHNTLLEIGDWSVILEYFRDIKKLDDEFGRYGKLDKRVPLMSQVKNLMDQMQLRKYKEFVRMIILLPEWRSCGAAIKAHDDYGGAQIGFDASLNPNFERYIKEWTSLNGIFARALAYLREPEKKPFDGNFLDDISNAMVVATEGERQAMGVDVLDTWGEFEMLTDIIIMLGTDGEDPHAVPEDARYRTHAINCQLSQKIFQEAFIDKPIKSVESLKSEAVCKKIWAELEKTSLKRAKKPLEKVLAFAPVAPTWTHKPPTMAPPPPPAPCTAEEGEKPSPADRRPRRKRPEPQQEQQLSVPIKEEQVVLPATTPPSPQTVPVYVVPNIAEPTPEPASVRMPKVKTRGTPKASPTTSSKNSSSTAVEQTLERTIYCVGRDAYRTMEKLLVTKDSLDWVDFEKAMAALEFSIFPTYGSAIVFHPPGWAKTSPFYVHRPHGSEMQPYKVRDVGARLKKQYGWTIDWFSDDKSGSESEASTDASD